VGYRVAQIYHHEQCNSELSLYVYEEHANGVYLYVQFSAVKTLKNRPSTNSCASLAREFFFG
jgi:hypothetical protein